MIFANIFYFFSAILIISFASGTNSSENFPLNIIWVFVLIVLFFKYNKNSFSRLRIKYNDTEENFIKKNSFDKNINKNMLLAVMFFYVSIIIFNLKFFVLKIPLIGKITPLVDIILMTVFILYLSIVWYWSYKCFADKYSLGDSAREHIKSNIKFNLAIIIPWFIYIVFEGLFSVLNIPIFNEIGESAFGYPLQLFLFIIILFIFTPAIIVKLWESEPMEEGELRASIRVYCKEQKVRFKEFLAWNALNKGLITAAVIGITFPFRYLLLTPKLIDLLSEDEIMAVVSHEVGHVKKKHMFFYLAFFFSAMPIFAKLSSYLIQVLLVTEPARSFLVFFYEPSEIFINIIMICLTLFFFIFYFRYFFGYLMRNFERQADLYCFESGINPEHLISSFEKLNTIINEPKEKKNWHHFNIHDRVEFLRKSVDDPSEIKKHNKKVKKSLLMMGTGVILILVLSFGFIDNKNVISREEALSIRIDRCKVMIKRNPDDYLNFIEYGRYNYLLENWGQAIAGFEKSLRIKLDQPIVLNNLAWLLLKCKDESYRNRTSAVKYAMKAWDLVRNNEISDTVFIIDTLAEAYYQNGLYDKAFSLSKKAKNHSKKDKKYYDDQYEKMKRAKLQNKRSSDTI